MSDIIELLDRIEKLNDEEDEMLEALTELQMAMIECLALLENEVGEPN